MEDVLGPLTIPAIGLVLTVFGLGYKWLSDLAADRKQNTTDRRNDAKDYCAEIEKRLALRERDLERANADGLDLSEKLCELREERNDLERERLRLLIENERLRRENNGH